MKFLKIFGANRLVVFSPGRVRSGNVEAAFERYKSRFRMMGYTDAKWTTPAAEVIPDTGLRPAKDSEGAKFYSSIHDPGDGEVDFRGCHRVLKSMKHKGWICVDLDLAKKGQRASYERRGRTW